ncbi:hypothetical protein V8F20_006399 [Naviculisporaceae sp. PSN 640]
MELRSQLQQSYDGQNAARFGTREPAEPNPWLARIPFELRHLISDYLINSGDWEDLDVASLSRLVRTCKALYFAFQPMLYRNVAFRHIDMTGEELDPQSNAVYAELINNLCNNPALAGCVRSLDFTDIERRYQQPLPNSHHDLITQHVERFATGRGRLSVKHNLPDIRSPEGYPAQVTALLLLLRDHLRKVRISLPWFLWTQNADRSVNRNSRQIPGIILRNSSVFTFPRLTHLALDYDEPRLVSVWGPGPDRDCCLQGDSSLLLVGAANLKVLILRNCNLAKLRSCIPATVTSLILQNCYFQCLCGSNPGHRAADERTPFLDSKSALESLTITFGKPAVGPNSPGNIRSCFRCHPNGTTTPKSGHEPLHHDPSSFYDGRTIANNAQIAERIIAAVATSPSENERTIEHVTVDLGFIRFIRNSSVNDSNIYLRDWHQSYGPSERLFAMGLPLFPNLRLLTVNCAFIMSTDDSGFSFARPHINFDKNVLIELTKLCRLTLETLQLTGVDLVSRSLPSALKCFVDHTFSDPLPDRALRRVIMYSDGPAKEAVVHLISEKYARPLRKCGVELTLFVSGPWENGEEDRKKWAWLKLPQNRQGTKVLFR